MNEFRIFFSWASENKNLSKLRRAIGEAIKTLNETWNGAITFLYDEATRNKSGSPDITQSIKEKISCSDCAIFDLSLYYGADENKKFSPNPNVIFEYGYAVSMIGEKRCITLLDLCQSLSEDILPFDIRQNRISKVDSGNFKNTKNQIFEFIKIVVESNPEKPSFYSKEKQSDIDFAKELIPLLEQASNIYSNRVECREICECEHGSLDELFRYLTKPEYFFFDEYLEKERKRIINCLEKIINIESVIFSPVISLNKNNQDKIEKFRIEVPLDSRGIRDNERFYKEIYSYHGSVMEYIKVVNNFRKLIKKKLFI